MSMNQRDAGSNPSGRGQHGSPGNSVFGAFGGDGFSMYGSKYIPWTTLLQLGLKEVFRPEPGSTTLRFGNSGTSGGLPIGGGSSSSATTTALTPETIPTIPTANGLGSVAPIATTGAKGGIIGGAAGAGSASAFSTWAPWLNAAVGAGGAYMSADAAKEAAKENAKPRTEYRTPYMNEYISKIVPYLLAQQQSVFENRMGRYNDLSGGKGVSTIDFSPLRALLSQISMSYSGLGDPNRPIMSAPLSGYPDSSNPYNQSAVPAPPVAVPRRKYSRIAME